MKTGTSHILEGSKKSTACKGTWQEWVVCGIVTEMKGRHSEPEKEFKGLKHFWLQIFLFLSASFHVQVLQPVLL